MEDADVVVGIFWKRFGTSGASLGTEHELQRAWTAWREARSASRATVDVGQRRRLDRRRAPWFEFRLLHWRRPSEPLVARELKQLTAVLNI